MTITAKFNGRCTKCGQTITIGERIEWTRGVTGASHTVCPAVPIINALPAVQVPVNVVDQSRIITFLNHAKDHGLKAPKVRFLAPDGKSELRLSLAGASSKYPGAVQVKIGYEWVGRINADGSVTRGIVGALLTTIEKIALNPAQAAKEYGALMGRCSFCNLPLTDAGSVEVGYGPICASHYGLPHSPKGTPSVKVVGDVKDVDFLTSELPEPRGKRFRTLSDASLSSRLAAVQDRQKGWAD